MVVTSLDDSYRYCETLTRQQAGNFYPAFRILPRGQRLSMCALYAFNRIADDCGDEDAPLEVKRLKLDEWRRGLQGCLRGDFHHPTHAALADTVRRHSIPIEYLEAVLDGVAMDLSPVMVETFVELRRYCYQVASAVGLACIHIWGFSDDSAKVYAEEAGIAFQLTNILRDLKEDAERDRVYLPKEDLIRHGYTVEELKAGRCTDAFRELMRFEVARARSHYDASTPLVPLLSPAGRAVFLMMSRTYRHLLDVIEANDYDVFSRRARVPGWKKVWFAMRVAPVRLGWLSS